MKKLIPLLIFFIISNVQSFANTNKLDCVNDAAVVAQVSSFTESGFLNCEFQCFLDLNYVDFGEQPTLFFQVGTLENPTAFKNLSISEEYLKSLEVEKVFHKENYKLRINFGSIRVRSGFTARLVVIQNGIESYIDLKPTSFANEITKMKLEDYSGLCKAEQFLKKIDFENLYNNLSSL